MALQPSNLEPKSIKNRPKSHPRCIQNRILFLIAFWIAFSLIFGWFSTSTSTKNQSKINQEVNSTTQQPRYRKTIKFGESSTFFIDFSYFALGMLRSKINKKRSNIHQKTSLQSIPQLVPILVPTWLHFGKVLGVVGSQVGTKSLQKSIQRMIKKMITFWMALETDFSQFWLQLAPNLERFWAIFWAIFGRHFQVLLALGAQDPLKIPPGSPQTPAKPDFHGFWTPT